MKGQNGDQLEGFERGSFDIVIPSIPKVEGVSNKQSSFSQKRNTAYEF